MSMMRLGIFQFAPALRDVARNSRHISEAAATAKADLLVTPELSLTGYDLRDDVHTVALPDFSCFDQPVQVGSVQREEAGVPFNVAQLIRDGRIEHTHQKVYLPTYGMFDEGRYFGKGQH